MSYSDIINIVSNNASRIFNDKIDGQKIHESIESANVIPLNSMPPNNITKSQNFNQKWISSKFCNGTVEV